MDFQYWNRIILYFLYQNSMNTYESLVQWFYFFIHSSYRRIQELKIPEHFREFRTEFADDRIFAIPIEKPTNALQKYQTLKEIQNGICQYYSQYLSIPKSKHRKLPYIGNLYEAAEGKQRESVINIIFLLLLVCTKVESSKQKTLHAIQKLEERKRSDLMHILKQHEENQYENSEIPYLEDKLQRLELQNQCLIEKLNEKIHACQELEDNLMKMKNDTSQIQRTRIEILQKDQQLKFLQERLQEGEKDAQVARRQYLQKIKESQNQKKVLKQKCEEQQLKIQAFTSKINKSEESKIYRQSLQNQYADNISLEEHEIVMKNMRNKYHEEVRKLKEENKKLKEVAQKSKYEQDETKSQILIQEIKKQQAKSNIQFQKRNTQFSTIRIKLEEQLNRERQKKQKYKQNYLELKKKYDELKERFKGEQPIDEKLSAQLQYKMIKALRTYISSKRKI